MYLKTTKKIVTGLLCSAILAGIAPNTADAASTKYVTSSTLKIRKEATASSKSIGQLKKGDKVTVYKTTKGWAKIKKNNKYYYVSAKYLSSEKKQAEKAVSAGTCVVNYAKKFIGNPYVYGGTSLTHGTDCSGFTKSVYAQFGYSLPHSSSAQRHVGKKVSWSEKQPGDIICYSGHVAIYMGDNKIIHASNPRSGIKVSDYIQFRSVLSVRRIIE